MAACDDWPWGVDLGLGATTLEPPEVTWTDPEPIGIIWLPDGTALVVEAERPQVGFVSAARRRR